jgi:hypothetical protein
MHIKPMVSMMHLNIYLASNPIQIPMTSRQSCIYFQFHVLQNSAKKNEMLARVAIKNPFRPANKIIIIALKLQKIAFFSLLLDMFVNYRKHAVEVKLREVAKSQKWETL